MSNLDRLANDAWRFRLVSHNTSLREFDQTQRKNSLVRVTTDNSKNILGIFRFFADSSSTILTFLTKSSHEMRLSFLLFISSYR